MPVSAYGERRLGGSVTVTVEVVRRFYAARNRDDLEGELAELHDDVVWDMSNSLGPYRGLYRGHDGFRRLRREAFETWDDVLWDPQDFIEVGERVVVPLRGRNRGRSGIELEWAAAAVYTLRDGKIARSELYQSKAKALEAASFPKQRGDFAHGSRSRAMRPGQPPGNPNATGHR
jgi:ketosteroid isomerase-like protein